MTGPTHIAIALSCGIIGGAGKPALALIAAGAMGGIRALIDHLTGAPGIMLEEYRNKGLTKCRVKGKLRWAKTEDPVYFLDGRKWHHALPGEMVWGQVLGNDIRLMVEDSFKQ